MNLALDVQVIGRLGTASTRHRDGPGADVGIGVARKASQAAPFALRVKLDDQAFAGTLPAGSVGDAAIFTDRVAAAHVVRKVLLRQIAITSDVNPF